MKKLILTMILLGITTNTHAGADGGGGGGGFCVNEKCVTLAEAGFRIQETFTKPILDIEIFKEIEVIANMIPMHKGYREFLIESSIGGAGVYKKVLSYNEESLNKIKVEYDKILASQNTSTENFVIYAVSDQTNTYLLPAFEELNTRSKALILIHEGIVRRTGSVFLALKVDGAILDALEGKFKTLDIIEGLLSSRPQILKDVVILDSHDMSRLLVAYVEHYIQLTKPYINFSDFIPRRLAGTQFNTTFSGREKLDLYCMSAADDATYYQKHNLLWKIMKANRRECFGVYQPTDRLDYIFGIYGVLSSYSKTFCAKVINADAIVALDYVSHPDYQSMGEIGPFQSLKSTPEDLGRIVCKNGKLENLYKIALY